MTVMSWEFESPSLHESHLADGYFAEIAQLVEHNLAKVGVASSSLVFRSIYYLLQCGSSSVGRASASQAEGREFEPRLPLHQ